MAVKKRDQVQNGITLLGLGPGDPASLTREAWDWLTHIEQLFIRTAHHPTVDALPGHLLIESFDEVYERGETFEAVYEEIIKTILARGAEPGGVTYAVPGHPYVAEMTCPEIDKRAQAAGIPVRLIGGLSFLEPTFHALAIDPFPQLILADAMDLCLHQTPGFMPSAPALIAQIYSRSVASDVKLTLMTAYPDEHPVKLVHGAGTEGLIVEELPLYEMDHSSHLGLLSSLYVPPLSPHASFESFQEIIARLRAEDGCPWDREQTHNSLRPFLLEETYEALDALDRGDMADLKEELGDLLLQIVLHAQIATEAGDFNIHHVLDGIGSKLVRRHPHVFSEVEVDGVSGVTRNWEAIKADERKEHGVSDMKGLLDGIPRALPALSQAQQIVERVSRVDFGNLASLGELEVFERLMADFRKSNKESRGAILGELLFSVASLAHRSEIDGESALREALNRFRRQVRSVEVGAQNSGKSLGELNEDEWLHLWSQTEDDEGCD